MHTQKLILENWRKFIAETNKAQNYGNLYIFENNTVSTISFYDRLNTLTESEEDISIFVEQWEKSVNYELDRLSEADVATLKTDPILWLSSQAYFFIDKFKEKIGNYLAPIGRVIRRIRKAVEKRKEKNPKLWKIGSFALKVVAILAVLAVISSAQAGGLSDPDQVPELIRLLQDSGATEQAQELANATSGGTIGLTPDTLQGLSRELRDGLQAIGEGWAQAAESQASQEALQAATDVANQIPDIVSQQLTNIPMQAQQYLLKVPELLQQGDQEGLMDLIRFLKQNQASIPGMEEFTTSQIIDAVSSSSDALEMSQNILRSIQAR